MANRLVGIVREVPKEGVPLFVSGIPGKNGKGELVYFRQAVKPTKVEELQSDDCRIFVLQFNTSFYYVNLIP